MNSPATTIAMKRRLTLAHPAKLENTKNGGKGMQSENNITVSLGKPVTIPVLVPVEHKSTPTCINDPFMVDGECYRVTAMSFGSPHGAVIVDDADSVDVPKVGSALGTHILFPKGASIVFIQVIDTRNLKARLWQRGKGETSFTPEAACVAGTAAKMLQKTFRDDMNVSMGGNIFNVSISWTKNGNEVSITGPADLLKEVCCK